MKIHTRENPYHCSLCGKESIPRSHMKSHDRENLNPYALCGREVISRNHPKRHSKRIIEKNPYHCTLCGKGLISRNHTKRHMKSLARENLYQCVAIELLKHQKYKKIIVWKGKSKIAKLKGTNNFKLKVQKSKVFKTLKNIRTQSLAHFIIRCCHETCICFLNEFQDNI